MAVRRGGHSSGGHGSGPTSGGRSGTGSVSDVAAPLLSALTTAAKAATTESPGDPKVIAAVRLGWLMNELTHGWSLNPVPQDLWLDEREKCAAQALELSELLDDLRLPGLHWAVVERLIDALQRGPAERAARELERRLVVSLAGSEVRFTEAYTLGGGLRTLLEDRGAEDDPELQSLVGALDALSSDLPSHAARGVANSLAEWSQAQGAQTADLADAQVNLWRAVIVGEKKGTELLEPNDYLAAARELEGKFARRALTSKWLWAALGVAIVLFGLGVYLLFVANGHAGKVAAGSAGVLAGLGITWKGIGGTLGKLVNELEVPLWGAELDGAITQAITLTKARKGEQPRASSGLSYADRRGRAIRQTAGGDPQRPAHGLNQTTAPPPRRGPGSLPYPDRPVGAVNDEMPFDHLVVVMMENHSFDNLLGGLSRSHPGVDGLTFDNAGNATNSNPATDGSEVLAFPLRNTAQAKNVSQSWRATHQQIDGGAMDGFVSSESGRTEAMGYYTPEVLPFAYSLATNFTLANRWFCSLPGPTYPNRRFLLAGTAFGGTVTDVQALLDHAPPNGTIFDRLSDHGISWGDYFQDVPMTFVIPSIVLKHLDHHHHIERFFEDCRTGNLPAVSFVDAGIGVFSSIASHILGVSSVEKEALGALGVTEQPDPAETEEDPEPMFYGEEWAHQVVEAILRSPAWSRTMLIYTYDEHGGYYDHVAPPPAIPPDDIAPKLAPGDPAGGYDLYGPRVPAIVASPYSKPGAVTDVVHDHTSVLATIEHKWNLPALTNRDANAATVMDFLDHGNAALLTPPAIQAPSSTGPSGPTESG